MNIFIFIILLGIINIVFGFLWKWVIVFPTALLFAVIKLNRAMLVVKAFGAYFLVSLTAMATMVALRDASGILQSVVYPLIGAFVLFMGFSGNAYEEQLEARMRDDYLWMDKINRNAWFNLIIMFGSIVLYICIFFIPTIADNSVNEWLYDAILWIYSLPVIGWLIGIGGVIFMVALIWHGATTILTLSGMYFEKLRGKRQQDT